MIRINTIASSSKGNAYFLEKNNDSLLLEAGVSFKKILSRTNFKASDVDGILLSHEHGDHSKSIKHFEKMGFEIYSSKGTIEALNLKYAHIVESELEFKLNNWSITPFNVQHDAEEPLGYLINHGDDYLVFATDTYYLEYVFPVATQFLIECNYCKDILKKNYELGFVHPKQYLRTLRSHMSLENLCKYFKSYDFTKVFHINLIHLSNDNSDKKLMIETINNLTGVPCYV